MLQEIGPCWIGNAPILMGGCKFQPSNPGLFRNCLFRLPRNFPSCPRLRFDHSMRTQKVHRSWRVKVTLLLGWVLTGAQSGKINNIVSVGFKLKLKNLPFFFAKLFLNKTTNMFCIDYRYPLARPSHLETSVSRYHRSKCGAAHVRSWSAGNEALQTLGGFQWISIFGFLFGHKVWVFSSPLGRW